MSDVSCHLCGGKTLLPLFDVLKDQKLVKCDGCSIVAVEPFDNRDYDDAFTGMARNKPKTPSFITRHVGYDGRSKSSDYRYASQLREIQKALKVLGNGATTDVPSRATAEARLLDYGCWNGDFMIAAREFGFKPWGIDVADSAIAYCREHQLDAVHVEDRDELPNQFQVVRLSHVLEHVEQPRDLLEFSKERLAPGGLLVVEVPNFAAVMSKMRRGSWRYVQHGHLFYFTPSTLVKLMENVGLTVLRTRTSGSVGLTSVLNRWVAPWSGSFVMHHPWALPAKKAYLNLMSWSRLGDYIRVFASRSPNTSGE